MRYLINASTEVYLDDYNLGELDFVNSFEFDSASYRADDYSVINAIQDYFENNLYYELVFEYKSIYDDGMYMSVSVLVDKDNIEADNNDIEEWKNGQKTLYSSNITLSVELCIDVNLKEIL